MQSLNGADFAILSVLKSGYVPNDSKVTFLPWNQPHTAVV